MLRIRGIKLTQAARRRSTSSRASFSPSSSEAQVLRITILSVIRKKSRTNSPQRCYYYVPGPRKMKAPLARIAYLVAFFAVSSYAYFTLRGPHGIPALLEKQRQIQEMQQRNAKLDRDIERMRDHIK